MIGVPADKLNQQAQAVLEHAVIAHRNKIKVYESLRNLNEVIGTEYGDRVLYELIQNAHDAHRAEDRGRIAVRLTIRSATDGTLCVANGGTGFRWKDVEAIMNLAMTSKEIGDSIGNKGLGFRSVEALTDDVRIFSRIGRGESVRRFDGYCFRFATLDEIEALLGSHHGDMVLAREVAQSIPRYLVPLPLSEQSDEVVSYARLGYASVVVVPLRKAGAIELAKRQVQQIADLEVPLLLFLDRIADFRIDVEKPNGPVLRRRLRRRSITLGEVPRMEGCRLDEVRVGEDRRFLVVRYEVDKARVLDAVKRSESRVPQIKRWLEWKGQPTVSVAVGLSPGAVAAGRFYNFMPMGDSAISPLFGYLDAPFFTDIDRRDADFDLPLNATLMKAAAEACAHAALHIAGQAIPQIPQRTVFDLVAWTGRHAKTLDAALDGMGSSLAGAPVIPMIGVDEVRWGSLSEVKVWPEESFSVMKAAEIAKRADARLVAPAIDGDRLDRLKVMADRKYVDVVPRGELLAEWSERFAGSLAERKAAARTWSRFYEDLNRIFVATDENLNALAGKSIILDRSKKLRPAGGYDAENGAKVFVRSELTRKRRDKDGVPLPPATLIRRYRFVEESIAFKRDTLTAFIDSDLVREYDPMEALSSLGTALGQRANDNRRREALMWAFKVWSSTGSKVQKALQSAQLHVPTSGGWQPATQTAFSSSWTSVGQTLENFLVQAANVSPDCRRARDSLLLGFADWPVVRGDGKRQWLDFLKLIGVVDGLRPVAGSLWESGPGWKWNHLIRNGSEKEALDEDWCQEALRSSCGYPNTNYRRKEMDEAWRLPGQLEHAELPDSAKELFHELVFRHLEAYNTGYFTFNIGRFERAVRNWDEQELPTPLATFLRSKAWIAVTSQKEEPEFRRARESWAARTRRDRPPRFLGCLSDTVSRLFEDSEELGDLVFGDALGLRDWHGKDAVPDRLQALAVVAPSLEIHDRTDFRREYRRAWSELSGTDALLHNDLDLAIIRHSRLETLSGSRKTPPTVIVAHKAQESVAKILSSTGHAVLEIGDASTEKVAERLAATGAFMPHQIDGGGVRLLVDGEPFVPRSSDPPLFSLQLGWLPEVVVLGRQILAERLELGVQLATVERRIRAIRVRRCWSITLVVDEEEVSPQGTMNWFVFEDSELPTLILSDALPLTWRTLSAELSGAIQRLIDSRLRFVEPLLLRLAMDQDPHTLDRPSDERLAAALKCDEEILHEHRAALRTDVEHILNLLIPVVAYFGGVALARQLKFDAERTRGGFDVSPWLRSNFSLSEPKPMDLIAACNRAPNRAELRRVLDLDYERFNSVLSVLGESALSNEVELRSMYDAYLEQMRLGILERLRRHHASDFREGRDLAVYVSRKSLAFLEFDPEWVTTRETLNYETVEAHVMRLLDEVLGQNDEVSLPSSRGLLERNRKVARDFASRAVSIVCAWCRRNQVPVEEPWKGENPQVVTRHLENAGLLDFDPIENLSIFALCHRACCWPNGMPQTLEPVALGLDQATVEEEAKRRERERQSRIIEERSIDFVGVKLDPVDPSFGDLFRQLAEQSIADDESWFERCKRPRLAEFAETNGGGGSLGIGANCGKGRRGKEPVQERRQAMGIASEWRAYQFLRRHHGEVVTETCWISRNRAHFFGSDEGDDAAGYDFCVKTPQAEWLYEVKSSMEDTGEFELTPNEIRVAASVRAHGRRQYRILYVPFVFSPDRWRVLILPNPMGDGTRNRFKQVGRGSVRFRFETSIVNKTL